MTYRIQQEIEIVIIEHMGSIIPSVIDHIGIGIGSWKKMSQVGIVQMLWWYGLQIIILKIMLNRMH